MRFKFLCSLALVMMALLANAGNRGDTLTVMTFNLHAGHEVGLQQMAILIRQYKPDFVALQEVDCRTQRPNCRHQNGRDFVTELAYFSGMQGFFGPAIEFSGGLYGIGLLTRHQFVDMHNIKLPHPTPDMEQRGLLEGKFVLPDGDTIVMACTHLEAFDDISRRAQVEFINQHYAQTILPVILAGDLNAPPGDAVIRQLAIHWRDCTGNDPTFSVERPSQKIDYILARPQQSWATIHSQVIPVAMSDHFPVIATIVRQGHN